MRRQERVGLLVQRRQVARDIHALRTQSDSYSFRTAAGGGVNTYCQAYIHLRFGHTSDSGLSRTVSWQVYINLLVDDQREEGRKGFI